MDNKISITNIHVLNRNLNVLEKTKMVISETDKMKMNPMTMIIKR